MKADLLRGWGTELATVGAVMGGGLRKICRKLVPCISAFFCLLSYVMCVHLNLLMLIIKISKVITRYVCMYTHTHAHNCNATSQDSYCLLFSSVNIVFKINIYNLWQAFSCKYFKWLESSKSSFTLSSFTENIILPLVQVGELSSRVQNAEEACGPRGLTQM